MNQFNKDKVFVLSALSDFYNNFDRFVNGRLEDRLYTALSAVDEFNRLSMDRQGEIVVELVKEMSTFSEDTGHEKVIYDESGFSSGAAVVEHEDARLDDYKVEREEGSDPILKKDEWDIENEKVGC